MCIIEVYVYKICIKIYEQVMPKSSFFQLTLWTGSFFVYKL